MTKAGLVIFLRSVSKGKSRGVGLKFLFCVQDRVGGLLAETMSRYCANYNFGVGETVIGCE